MFSPTRNPLQLLFIPILLIVILFFTLHTNKGTYPPPVKQHEELSIPSDAQDWEFDGALKKIQQISGGSVDIEQKQEEVERKDRKVQLDLTVMSRCPDAVSRFLIMNLLILMDADVWDITIMRPRGSVNRPLTRLVLLTIASGTLCLRNPVRFDLRYSPSLS
jgi:hypothetical protein